MAENQGDDNSFLPTITDDAVKESTTGKDAISAVSSSFFFLDDSSDKMAIKSQCTSVCFEFFLEPFNVLEEMLL